MDIYEYKIKGTSQSNREFKDSVKNTELAHSKQGNICLWIKNHWYVPTIVAAIIVAGIVSVIIISQGPKGGSEDQKNNNNPPPGVDLEKAKEVFSQSFKVNSKVNTLIQLLEKSIQEYVSIINGTQTKSTILEKFIYDTYTINSTEASEKEKDFFTYKYNTIITVNSLCSKQTSNPEEDNCVLEKNLDLNIRDNRNLRRNENEEDIENLIRQAILPLCIVEHTDTNLILSVTCPETLQPNYKNKIIRAFNNIKPESMKGFEFDKNYVNTIKEEKEDKIYITSFDNVCSEITYDPTKTVICNLTKDIVTDKEGNLISNKFTQKTKTIIDENNLFINTITYKFENIPKENSDSFNQDLYITNFNSLFSLSNFLMKKEIKIENFTSLVYDIMTEPEIDNNNARRVLMEQSAQTPGIQEENVFNNTIFNISMHLNLKNDIGFGEGQSAGSSSTHDINQENYTELSRNSLVTGLNEVLNKFIVLSKSGNKLAKDLYDKLNEPLLQLRDLINENFEKINGILAHKDLSEIFDSTLAINGINELPYEFVTSTANLYNAIKDLRDNLLYTINNQKKKLKNDISDFLAQSHNLIFKIFNNLTDLTNVLSSGSNRIVEIASYYLNNTDISFYDIIIKAKTILDAYPEKEKELLLPLINTLVQDFYQSTLDDIQKYLTMLDNISERLNEEQIIIKYGNTEHYQTCINNIYNSKNQVNEIIETIKTTFEENNLKSNGYFETQAELDSNAQSYGAIGEKAIRIASALDKNTFIDTIFDEIATSFRNKFITLLKYMENSVKEKFPLEENVLSTSLFNLEYIKEIDDYFKNEKTNVLNFIKHENDEYLSKVNANLSNFQSKNGQNLEQIMVDVTSQLTDINLDNLNKAYSESLDLTLKTITEIITGNKKLGNDYLNDVRNANSFHITTGFKNKYNIFINSITEIQNFINNNLKINLSNKYKNVINQIRALLQSIKSNKILEKYYKQLPIAEKHLNIIKDLFNVFNKHIIDDVYNTRFLPLINNYIKNTNDNLNQIKIDFKKIYDEIATKGFNDILNDYDKQRIVAGSRYCCKRRLGICWRHCRTPDIIYYDGYNVGCENNYQYLTKINFENYIKHFDNEYQKLYSQLSSNIISYNSHLSNLDKIINTIKNSFVNEDTTYLNNIAKKINTIISEKLGNKLLEASYNYFKDKVTKTLPNELNSTIEQWVNAYEDLYDDINTNKDKFKSSALELYLIGYSYLQVYQQNISYTYSKTIVDKLKNEFNYINKYYYDLIIFKLNKTYDYILHNLPINEKPLDDILNLRTNQIKQSYNNLLSQLKNSKNEILDKNKQLVVLQVNENNFFYINDIISEHINTFSISLSEKIDNIFNLCIQNLKDNPEELIVAKFYLENSINGKQMKGIYEMTDTVTFIDLQTAVFQQLVDDICKIDKDELIKSTRNTLNTFNENISNSFKYQKEEYIKILQDKLYSEFNITKKEDLDNKIISLFSNGINNNLNENSKAQIETLLNSVLNNIKTHITNEASRLDNEITSYSSSYKAIKDRLTSYKNTIYDKFISTITYIVNDFYDEIMEKFYTNFIKKGLDEFERNIASNVKGNAEFLNMSINLTEIINKESNLIITEYRNLTFNQIKFLWEKNYQTLENFFSFSSLKLKINNEIDNVYNTQLLPILQKVATHNSGDEGISDYDLSKQILDDIDSFLNVKITNVKSIIQKMEGTGYIINNISPADFSAGQNSIYEQIKKKFDNFTLSYKAQEEKDFDKSVGDNILNNFNNLMDNFIPSFGIIFFDRILKYNEIQKIKMLYLNMKYSLQQTIIYYIFLVTVYSEENIRLPIDIKLRLLNLNNLDTLVKSKNNFILSNLNEKIDGYFEEIKNNIVQKYINEMNTEIDLDDKLISKIRNKIKGLISGNIHHYENKFIKMMKDNIKEPFIQEYTTILNSSTEDMKNFIEDLKITLKVELDSISSLNSDSVLAEVQNKLNLTNSAVEEYNEHFDKFIISKDVKNFLNNFGKNYLIPKYKDIKDLLDRVSAELIINNLETLSNQFRTVYDVETFKNEINKIDQNFSSYFDKLNEIIKDYGSIESVYSQNLNKEIANYRRIRLLDELEPINENGHKIADVKLENTFNDLKNSSLLIKDFIQSFNLFENFEDKINQYTNEKNQQYLYIQYVLDNNKDNNNNYELMKDRLEELKHLSLTYLSETHNLYNSIKEQIIGKVITINELVNSCENVTYEIISNNYIDIKNQFNKIEETQNSEKKEIEVPPYTQETDSYFTVETKVENYLINSKFLLDIIFYGDAKTPKIIGKVENRIKPKKFDINFYSKTGQNGKLGRMINITFNNISAYTTIEFDAGLNQATIITNFIFDEYNIKTQYYEQKSIIVNKIIGGTIIQIPGVSTTTYIDTPIEEKSRDIPAKNITLVENYVY